MGNRPSWLGLLRRGCCQWSDVAKKNGSEKLDEKTPQQPSPSTEQQPSKIGLPISPINGPRRNSVATGDQQVILESESQAFSIHPPNVGNSHRRWTNEVLEGFLESTMVDGTGLVLVELESGSRKKEGEEERILTYNPYTTELLWKSCGSVQKEGGLMVKAIVQREGAMLKIPYLGTAAEGDPWKKVLKSLLRRTRARREEKIFQSTAERDAQSMQDILYLLHQK